MTVVQLLLLLSGDVELNPGPPKRTAVKAPPKKTEEIPPPPVNLEANFGALETKVTGMVNPPHLKQKNPKKNSFNAYKAFVLYAFT